MTTSIGSDLRIYRLQIMNFLTTVTIKYSPLATLINTALELQGYTVDPDNPQTWKYYLNLCGEYHVSDTMMVIKSLDTRQDINFTKDVLVDHPRTLNAYYPGSSYYTRLCQDYPNQTDLIKSILYPVTDMDTALDAQDITMLSYGSGFLEAQEEGYILNYLNRTLDYLATRWHLDYLSYEPYFYITFWGMLWNTLTIAAFTARVMAIRTVEVHTWHIWQYIQSNGLDDYSDILSQQKAMFLYRNLEYIIENRGKTSNLGILADALLGDLFIGLFGRDTIQQTQDGKLLYQLTPEFLAKSVHLKSGEIDESVPAESVLDMNARLVAVGDEVDTTTEHIQALSKTLSATTLNTYPTKVLELRPLPRDRKYAEFFNVFIMDTLVYLISQDQYSIEVEIYTDGSSDTISLTTKEALVFLYYAINKAQGGTPINLPTQYTSRTAYRIDQLPIPTTLQWMSNTYYLTNYVDVPGWIKDSTYPALSMKQALDFSNTASSMFLVAVSQIVQSRSTSDIVTARCMEVLSSCVNLQETIALDLIPGITTYDQWFNIRPDLYKLYVESYDSQVNAKSKYDTLATAIITKLVPVTSVMNEYGNFSVSDEGYTRLKQLFESLCSYNVTFLETTRDVYQFMFIEEVALTTTARVLNDVMPYAMTLALDISPTLSGQIDTQVDDPETDISTRVLGTVGIEVFDAFSFSTKASNKALGIEEIPVKPKACSIQNSVGVDISFDVSVGVN